MPAAIMKPMFMIAYMSEKEIERCRVVEYRRAAAISTGVPNASPIAKGSKPPANDSHRIVVNAMTARATRQTKTPRKKVRRRPNASVTEPDNDGNAVMAGAQIHATKTNACWSLNPRSDLSHKISVPFVTE